MTGHVRAVSLSLIALGEPVDRSVVRHVRSCPSCERTVASLRTAASASAAAATVGEPTERPPERIWAGVLDAVAADSEVRTDTSRARAVRSRDGTGLRVGLAAAMAAALTLVVVLWPDGRPAVVAEGSLAPLTTGTGVPARIVQEGDERRLELGLGDLDAEGDAYHEVWIGDDELGRLVSLGPVTAEGSYPLPRGLDLDVYHVVDISTEPLDGDPTHSGDSILRGALATTA